MEGAWRGSAAKSHDGQHDHHEKSRLSAKLFRNGSSIQSGQIGRDAHASLRVLVARAARLACVPIREAIDLDQAF